MHIVQSVILASTLFVSQLVTAENFDIIAHRGASGYLPEHTLEAATLAFAQGPDYIEQDVVITQDGVPVVLHDIHLETVTNVEEVFPSRARQDGRYYALDFTLAELKRLHVHERTNNKGEQVFKARYSGSTAHFTVATLEEHFELITQLNRQFNTNIGVYPEVKSPAWHRKEGVDSSKIVIATLAKYNFADNDSKSYLQCFDYNEVKRIRSELGYQGKLVMLIGDNDWGEAPTNYDWIRSEEGMKEVAKYADGIGPWLGHLLNKEAMAEGELTPSAWLTYAHQNDLVIHPYTFRQDALPEGMNEAALLSTLKEVVKVNGIFTDHVPAVTTWRDSQSN